MKEMKIVSDSEWVSRWRNGIYRINNVETPVLWRQRGEKVETFSKWGFISHRAVKFFRFAFNQKENEALLPMNGWTATFLRFGKEEVGLNFRRLPIDSFKVLRTTLGLDQEASQATVRCMSRVSEMLKGIRYGSWR